MFVKRFLLFVIIVTAALAALSLAPSSAVTFASASEKRNLMRVAHDSESILAADKNVLVTVCGLAGDIVVRGWDQNKVRVRSADGEKIELQSELDSASNASAATRIRVLAAAPITSARADMDCRISGNLELDVPRGATVQLKTRGSGNVSVEDVMTAQIKTLSGDVAARGVTKAIEAASINGHILLEDSKGRARLTSVSGNIVAKNLRTIEETDEFSATSVSGDIALEEINHARVIVRTVSGLVSWSGKLARGAYYGFSTTSGEMTLNLPADSSFQISATVSIGGEIDSDFSFSKSSYGFSSDARTLVGKYSSANGSNDATLNLLSFSGFISLRKK